MNMICVFMERLISCNVITMDHCSDMKVRHGPPLHLILVMFARCRSRKECISCKVTQGHQRVRNALYTRLNSMACPVR